MAEQFQTSFIPKKTFDATAQKPAGRSNILLTIGVVILVLAVLSAGGIFAYEKFLGSSIEKKREALQRARDSFAPEFIRELSHLDAKIQNARSLLKNHIAVSGIFDLLQATTLETVQFTSFGYAIEDQGIRVSMEGVARSFSSVALQSDGFSENRFISEPVFSGLQLNERGDVAFSASILVDPAAVSYEGRMQDAGSAAFEIPNESVVNATATSGSAVEETVSDSL